MFSNYLSNLRSFFNESLTQAAAQVIPKNYKCCICDAFIVGQYYKHPVFEDDIFCTTHDPNRICFCCHRHEPLPQTGKEPFAVVNDGRLCMDCVSAIVSSPDETKTMYSNAVDFLEHVLGLSIPHGMRDNVPIQLVNQTKLRSLLQEQSIGTDALGLTVYQELRISAMGFFSVTASKKCTVYVLDSLQRDLCTKVIVHEAMHVWIKLNPKFSLSLPGQTEEGLCEYIAAQWLEYAERTSQFERNIIIQGHNNDNNNSSSSSLYCQEVTKPPSKLSSQRSSSNANPTADFAERQSQLRKFYLLSLQTSSCPVYGEGYRVAKRACDCMGLHSVLTYVADNKELPADTSTMGTTHTMN